jgi:hypothetical protein
MIQEETTMRTAARSLGLIVAMLFAFAGCHELGHRDGPPIFGGGGGGGDVSGEVISHNSQYNIIEIAQRRGGTLAFVYDRGTNIQYRGRGDQNIGPGDEVIVTLRDQRDSAGRPFASGIIVRQYPEGYRGGPVGGEVFGEVISHDSQQNVIEISQRRGGTFAFVYDRGTNIQYRGRGRQNIGPGDEVIVTLRSQRDSAGRPFASGITVRQR